MSIKDEYFWWLCDLVHHMYPEYENRDLLLKHLAMTVYFYTLPRDEARETDGFDLRLQFLADTGRPDIQVSELDDPVSFLEVLVSMAVRCEDDIMHDEEYGDRTYLWFWEIISSMGLLDCTNDVYDKATVGKKLSSILERKFGRDGKNGMFYMPDKHRDLRKIDWWQQFYMYINDKYFEI